MYVYQRKVNKKRLYLVAGIALMLLVSFTWLLLQMNQPKKATPVISEKEDEVVITLPNKEETIQLPFKVEASVVLEYFDGSDHEVADFTNLNGTYRPNQGIDYAYNNEAFEVMSMISGSVSEVKQDELFGHSVSITNKDLVITYQSLGECKLKKGDVIKQGDVIALASSNTYNPELSNHVHIVVTKNGKTIDPKTIIGKSMNEIK